MSFPTMLNQTVTIYNRATDFDRYGNAVFTVGADYPARVQKLTKDILKPNGETVNITLMVFLRGDVSVNNDDKLVYNGSDFKVVNRDEMVIRDGSIHHLTLSLTGWTL